MSIGANISFAVMRRTRIASILRSRSGWGDPPPGGPPPTMPLILSQKPIRLAPGSTRGLVQPCKEIRPPDYFPRTTPDHRGARAPVGLRPEALRSSECRPTGALGRPKEYR